MYNISGKKKKNVVRKINSLLKKFHVLKMFANWSKISALHHTTFTHIHKIVEKAESKKKKKEKKN